MTTATEARGAIAPSPVFYGLLIVTGALAGLLWQGQDLGGVGIFLFVAAGWIVSLTLHEFGHAYVAYISGDHTVADKGYLTLDVRKYTDPGLSLVMPVLFLLIGGIGLPGGAVWINHSLIRSRVRRSLVSFAGPAATALCALVCLVPIRMGVIDETEHGLFLAGLGFLGAIQVIALVLNLLPVPGLDGFGIIEPHLSPETRRALAPVRQYGFIILIAALWVVPAVSDGFWSITDTVSEALGGETIRFWRSVGWNEFRFWT